MPAVIITITWKTLSWKTIILLAGLQSIPNEFYEASSIDGASRLQQFWKITLPLLSPAMFFALIIGIINTLQIFDPIFIMTDGGPADSTRTLSYYIYTRGFQNLRMGYAAALSWVLFVIILLFTLIQWILQKRWVFYQ
jgi:multiple sugar transport system permease protein